MELLIEPCIVRRNEPINVKKADHCLFDNEYEKQLPAVYLEKRHFCYVLQDVIFHFRPPYFLQKYCSLSTFSGNRIAKRLQMLLFKGASVKNAVWCIDNWSEAYFHWIADALTRYIVTADHSDNHVLLLPNRYREINYVIDSITLLGIKVYYYDPMRKLRVNHLLTINHTAPIGNFNPLLIKKLRARFLEKFERVLPYRRLYVSRYKAPKRKIVNEKSLCEILERYNIETIFFEDLSLEKQIIACMESNLIIGLHGAGLTNMLFLPSESTVFELRNKGDNSNNCFFSMAAALGHRYCYQECLGDTSTTHIANVSVDLVEFESNLSAILDRKIDA